MESWEPLEITIKSPYQVFTIFMVSLLNTKMAGSGNWLHAWNKKSTVQKRFTMYSVYSYCLLVKFYCIIWWMNRKNIVWFVIRKGGSETFQDKQTYFCQEVRKFQKSSTTILKIDRSQLLYSVSGFFIQFINYISLTPISTNLTLSRIEGLNIQSSGYRMIHESITCT